MSKPPMNHDQTQRVSWAAALLCAALLLPSALAFAIDARMLNDISVWTKPLKFQASFALHWATIALLLSCASPASRARVSTVVAVRAAAFATVLEVLYITLQAARGRASHFNFSTPWETVVYYGVMGVAAIVIVAVTAWLGWRIWRDPAPGLDAGLRHGAALGLILGGVITLVVTAPLAAGALDGPGHWVGGIKSDLHGLPLTGWSTTGGDLRASHFFATHLTQALPLVGLLASRLTPRYAVLAVRAAAGAGVVVAVATFLQAAAKLPLIG